MGPSLVELLVVGAVASAFWPLGRALRSVESTTLGGAVRWSLFALAGWTVMSGVEASGSTLWAASHLRYAAAALGLCPMVAVLGARKPGQRAWHFVVLALLVVLLAPLVQAALRDRWERPLRLDDVWALLFAGVLFVGVANYVPTRLGAAACLVGLALAAATASVSPWAAVRTWSAVQWAAPMAPLGVSVGVWLGWWDRRRTQPSVCARSWDRLWRDFREHFGLIWSRRVQERFNASARQLNWPVRLGWSGFVANGEDQPLASRGGSLDTPGPPQTALRSLLRRFVSDAWIAERVPSPTHDQLGE